MPPMRSEVFPMTDDSEARIAAGLTKAQADFLLSLPDDGEKVWPKGMSWDELTGLRGFGQSGLIRSWYGDGVRHGLTPLGLRVKSYLQSKGDEA